MLPGQEGARDKKLREENGTTAADLSALLSAPGDTRSDSIPEAQLSLEAVSLAFPRLYHGDNNSLPSGALQGQSSQAAPALR